MATALDLEGWEPRLTAEACVHSIGSGKPYFSLTGSITVQEPGTRRRQEHSGGMIHKEVLAAFPGLAPIAALHLADEDGVPMHAEANGWYWLSGVWGDTGEPYTPASGHPNYTPNQSLATFASHARVSEEDARSLAAQLQADYSNDIPARRAAFATWIDTQRPRWAAEAAAGKDLIDRIALDVVLAEIPPAASTPLQEKAPPRRQGAL